MDEDFESLMTQLKAGVDENRELGVRLNRAIELIEIRNVRAQLVDKGNSKLYRTYFENGIQFYEEVTQ